MPDNRELHAVCAFTDQFPDAFALSVEDRISDVARRNRCDRSSRRGRRRKINSRSRERRIAGHDYGDEYGGLKDSIHQRVLADSIVCDLPE